MRDKVVLLGVEIDNVMKDEALAIFDEIIKSRVPSLVVTPNVDHIMNIQKDAEFREIYKKASLVLTDGVPLMWASRFLGTPIKEKIAGSDVFHDICRVGAKKGYRIFLMGGREGAAERTVEIMRERHPSIQIVGHYSPPVGFEDDEREMKKIENMLAAAKPDVLFLGLGSPKQEKFYTMYSVRFGIPVTMGIGITFEYVSGMVKRAPVWMQKAGLEWLYRLIKEPKRLWKRYLINDPGFFWLVLKQKIFAK
ncbi:MAG: WecB/TagA/CpsF family glycosyltransferase [Spirochaetes bacterium]|nr:WecB/TagA/CpsF family glycosyltransferase [Spirochaetota bacterium]